MIGNRQSGNSMNIDRMNSTLNRMSKTTNRIFRNIEDMLEKLEPDDACKFESMELFEEPDSRDIDSDWESSRWEFDE